MERVLIPLEVTIRNLELVHLAKARARADLMEVEMEESLAESTMLQTLKVKVRDKEESTNTTLQELLVHMAVLA